MRLLIVTQAVDRNNPVLGFFLGWIREFAKHCERVTVVALEMGEYDLPENVRVLSLGKESGRSRFKYLWRFYKYIWQERRNYDTVFVHMNQIYVILGGALWRSWGKKVGLWYVHRQVGWGLRIAEKLVQRIFTVSREGFNLKSKKVTALGHGIDVECFKMNEAPVVKLLPQILSVGRISRIKRLDILIGALKSLKKRGCNFKCELVGTPVNSDDARYQAELKAQISKSGLEEQVSFLGPIAYAKMPGMYRRADLHVNLAPTGGVDKAALEAMISGVPSVVCNRAFEKILGPFARTLIVSRCSVEDLADRLYSVLTQMTPQEKSDLAELIASGCDLSNLVKKILAAYEQAGR